MYVVWLQGGGVGRCKELVAFLSFNIPKRLGANGLVFSIATRGSQNPFYLYIVTFFLVFTVILYDLVCYRRVSCVWGGNCGAINILIS